MLLFLLEKTQAECASSPLPVCAVDGVAAESVEAARDSPCMQRVCLPAVPTCEEVPLSMLLPIGGDVDVESTRETQSVPIAFLGGRRYQQVHIEFLSPDCSRFNLLAKVEASVGGFLWNPTPQNFL